ncbi:DUF1559 domain-containing protein [Mariniblastus sp.]|nr:DUF1559 domain-containing protein [Mariniblastus sp.]
MVRKFACHRHGLSRIELCVVLIAFAVLAAIAISAIQRVRESARRSTCRNTMNQLGNTLQNYHSAMNAFPQGCVGNTALAPSKRWSWHLSIGAYWGHYGTPVIDYQRPWDDPALRPLQLHTWTNGPDTVKEFDIPLIPCPIIKCPNGTSQTHTDGQPYTDYVATAGIGAQAALLPRTSDFAGVWAYEERRSIDDIQDGASNTLIAIETSSGNGCWLSGGPATVRGYEHFKHPIGNGKQFGGLHHDGSMAVYADGHVRYIPANISPDVFSSALTIAGSEEEVEVAPKR